MHYVCIVLLLFICIVFADVPSSPAVRVGDTVYVSGQVDVSVGDDTAAQLHAVLRKVDSVLASVGLSKHHIVKSEGLLADISDLKILNVIYNEWMSGVDVLPAMTVSQAAFLKSQAKVEIAMVASTQPKEGTNRTRGKSPAGSFTDFPLPFTDAVTSGDFVYLSGLQGMGATSEEQILDAFRNIDATLASVGLDKTQIVQVEGILADIGDLATLNFLYNRWLSGREVLPAMLVYQPTNLCGHAKVEITVVATVLPAVGANLTTSPPSDAFPLPFTDVVGAGPRVYLSGFLNIDAGSSTRAQLAAVLEGLSERLALAGLMKDHIVQSRVVLANIHDLELFSTMYGDWLSGVRHLPALLVHQPANLCAYARVEVELVAARSQELVVISV